MMHYSLLCLAYITSRADDIHCGLAVRMTLNMSISFMQYFKKISLYSNYTHL